MMTMTAAVCLMPKAWGVARTSSPTALGADCAQTARSSVITGPSCLTSVHRRTIRGSAVDEWKSKSLVRGLSGRLDRRAHRGTGLRNWPRSYAPRTSEGASWSPFTGALGAVADSFIVLVGGSAQPSGD